MNAGRRRALSKLMVGMAGAAAVGGSIGYVVGAVSSPLTRLTTPLAMTVERVVTRTVTQEVLRTISPRLEPLDVKWGLVEGARSAVPTFLIYENRKEIAERNGLNVVDYQVLRGAEGLKALVEKRIDILGPDPIMQFLSIINQAVGMLKIVFFADTGMQASLAVRPDLPYNSLEDIRSLIKSGKKIVLGSSTAGSLSHSYAIVLANILGTRIGQGIELVFLGDLTAITAALSRGEIDGFAWAPPVHWRLESQGKVKVIFYFKDYAAGNLWHERVIVTRDDVLKERPEVVRRFINFYRDLIKTYELERDYVISLMAEPTPKGFGFTKEMAERWYLYYRPNHLGAPIREALYGARDLAIASGIAKELPQVEQWYTTEFL